MKYSIITINYNHCNGLRKTIESVINQSYKDFEYIVIDGGSTDSSREVIEEYDSHISYWVSETDKGIYNAMNKGIMAADGEFLIFMNSGDTFYNNLVLENSLPYMHDDIVQGIAKNHDYTETPLCLVKIPNRTELFSPSLHHQSCFFKKKLFETSLYDENYKIVSDWKFYIEQLLFHHCTFTYMPVIVAIYEGGGVSESEKDVEFEERRDILEKLSKRISERNSDIGQKEMMLHLMFTSKLRFLINKKLINIDKYIDTFPESNAYYKYYPFDRKQKILFFLARHQMRHILKAIVKILEK